MVTVNTHYPFSTHQRTLEGRKATLFIPTLQCLHPSGMTNLTIHEANAAVEVCKWHARTFWWRVDSIFVRQSKRYWHFRKTPFQRVCLIILHQLLWAANKHTWWPVLSVTREHTRLAYLTSNMHLLNIFLLTVATWYVETCFLFVCQSHLSMRSKVCKQISHT